MEDSKTEERKNFMKRKLSSLFNFNKNFYSKLLRSLEEKRRIRSITKKEKDS